MGAKLATGLTPQVDLIKMWDRLVQGGVWAITGRFGSIILSALLSFLLARMISPGELGVYFLILSIVSFGSTLGMLGLNHTVVRLISASVGEGSIAQTRNITGRVLALTLLGALLICGLLFFGGADWLARTVFRSELLDAVTPWLILITFLTTFQQIGSQIYRGTYDIRNATLFGGLIANGMLVLTLILMVLFASRVELRLVLLITSGALAASVMTGLFLIYLRIRALAPEPSNLSAGAILHQTWPLFVSSIVLLISGNADLWIVGALKAEEAVGVYGAVLRLVLFVSTPLMIVNAVLPPIIGEYYARGDQRRLETILRSTASLAAVPAAVVSIGFILFPRFTLGLAFGPEYQGVEAVIVLVILCLGRFFDVFFGSCGNTLIMTGHQDQMMRIALFSGVLTVSLELVLAPRLGLPGIAAGVSFGMVIQNILMWSSVKQLTGMWTHPSPTFLPAVLAAYRSSRLKDGDR